MSGALAAALAASGAARRRFVEGLGAEPLADDAVVYVLRRLVAADADADVRAAAAVALGRAGALRPEAGQGAVCGSRCAAWLVESLRDVAPSVREAAVRGVAACRWPGATAPLAALSRGDEVWWVRRAAVYGLGALGGLGDGADDEALAAVRLAVGDPFWRVRHAAVAVLAAYGQRSAALRGELLEGVPAASASYVRALWGPAEVSGQGERAPQEPPLESSLPEALRDRDPAVVTARLAALADVRPRALVELLCDPHEPLRAAAAARVAASGDAAAHRLALRWLEEPRIPHVARTVTALLDGLGAPARALAAEVLAQGARPGALRWAIGYVVATRDDELAEPALARARAAGLLLEALPLVPARELSELATAVATNDDALALAAADELTRRPAAARAEALAEAPLVADPRVAARLAIADGDARGRHAAAALAAVEPLPRAVALARLVSVRDLSSEMRTAALADPDPMVREAVVPAASSAELAALLGVERDPWVRRAAAHALGGKAVPRELRARLAPALAADGDAALRACAVAWLDEAAAELLGVLAADPAPAVRAAVIERLAETPDDQLDALWRAAPATAAAWRAAGAQEPSAAGAVGAAPAPAPLGVAPATSVARPLAPPVDVPRVTLGSSGIRTARLAISGAFELSGGSLQLAAEAGVELFFWEPTYRELTKFLRASRRRERARVVTGSYHADAASIRADVDTALRRLRRDRLDVFLLFWARSAARLDDEAFAALAELRARGKVGAIGFSTHDRELAGEALARAPWDVVMTRHSAAHPGAEAELFGVARERGAAVLTFSALCYGRMVAGPGAPSAADCYRYSLSQPGVSACISAPRRHRELVENLEVLARPTLSEAELSALRRHGEGVRAEDQRFGQLIRKPTRDAAAAAMAMLEAELGPEPDAAAVRAAEAKLRRRAAANGKAAGPGARLRRGRW